MVYASGQDNALAAARTRIGTWLFVTLGGTLSFGGHAVMLLGFWAALRLIADGAGLAAGLGYVALFGLIAHRMGEWRRHPAVVAVAAVGRRSLSSYLAHSLIFAPLLAAWGLGLGALLGSATMAAFAVGVWLVTVVGAYAMERAGRQGPAEALPRRLTYGTAGRAAAGVRPLSSRGSVRRSAGEGLGAEAAPRHEAGQGEIDQVPTMNLAS